MSPTSEIHPSPPESRRKDRFSAESNGLILLLDLKPRVTVGLGDPSAILTSRASESQLAPCQTFTAVELAEVDHYHVVLYEDGVLKVDQC